MSDVNNNEDFNPKLEEDTRSGSKKKLLVLLFAGTLGLGLLLFNVFNYLEKSKEEEKPVKKEETLIKKKAFSLPKPEPKPQLNLEPEPKPLPLLPPQAVLPKQKKLTPKMIKGLSGNLVNFNGSKPSSSSSRGTPPTGNKAINSNQANIGSSVNSGAKPFHGGNYSVAGVHHLDPNLFLPRGTYIGCSLKTRLVSMVTGQIACTVSNDIYSANGNVLLIEKGSEIIGSYKTGKLNDGMDRHFVIWETIRTPNNIVIDVNSPASDELGSAGIHGDVDHHWGVRLGMALMVSLIDDSINALSQRASGTDQVIYASGTSQQTTEDITKNLIDKFSSIKPTLYKNHGDIVGVFVNQDIDFSKVYNLRRKR